MSLLVSWQTVDAMVCVMKETKPLWQRDLDTCVGLPLCGQTTSRRGSVRIWLGANTAFCYRTVQPIVCTMMSGDVVETIGVCWQAVMLAYRLF